MMLQTIQRPPTTARCENCGDAFAAARVTARYCGDRCRKAANRAREGAGDANSAVPVPSPSLSVTSAPETPPRGRLSEERDDYPHVVMHNGDRSRVIECKGDIQWILQRRSAGADTWRGVHFCRTRAALIRVCGFTESTAPAELAGLPEMYGG